MTTIWLDCETYSEADLREVGTYAYAEHPSTEILVVQWAVDDGEPQVRDCTGRAPAPRDLLDLLRDPSVTVVAHNSAFDRTVLRHAWAVDVPVARWRDTMARALAHGLPGALDKLGQIVGVADDEAKDKRGRELIQLFCKPRPATHRLRRATRETHPDAWAEFLEYSRQDIVAMRAIDSRLPSWNYRDGHPELSLWHLDQRVNDRGFAVDSALAQAAVRAVEREQARIRAEVRARTDGLVGATSQTDRLLAFILAEYGVALPDLKADTLRRRLDDPELPEGVKRLIALRLEATKTSTAKYKTLLRAASKDGRLRGTMQFCGAQRTGRWAGRLFQPQNMPRPSAGFDEVEQEQAIDALLSDCADLVYDDVMRVTADVVRGCIVAAPGRKLVVADLSNIEGRVLAWLADEQWKLRAFADYDTVIGADERGDPVRKGHDLYVLAYARAFNTAPQRVQKWQRQIGKVMELALGYEGGVAAFLTFAAVYQMDLAAMAQAVAQTAPADALADADGVWQWAQKNRRTLGLSREVYVACEVLKAAWRAAHPCTVALWKAAGDGVRAAIMNQGQTFSIGQHLKARRDGAWLRIRLPSGRYLCYINPAVDDDGSITYFGVNQYTRQWGRIKTYGGKLVENITQAVARDVLASNMQAVERAGYPIVLSVHDELLTEPMDSAAFTAQGLAQLMATAPAWAAGLPLSAAGFEAHRYRKD
ncbi:MAG: DNA polymerase [Burkholderiaceae bacterium]|nr:DNA polymerase [Burkholderiaceae bacterium]